VTRGRDPWKPPVLWTAQNAAHKDLGKRRERVSHRSHRSSSSIKRLRQREGVR